MVRFSYLSKLVYEALLRLAWKGFPDWLHEHHLQDVSLLAKIIQIVKTLNDDISREGFEVALKDQSCSIIIQRFLEYRDHLRSTDGQLAEFWISYVDLVETLLALAQASRECNWVLHLVAIRNILPWTFAYDK